ncbi:uncharacterized protein LOC143051817 isoform X2 [Mytilus galloprovincialis]|uniref:uncharacterized protein LOC143051817 isoform X2 n=1 Tax=Mytilus galloprovincialis TaxID=29158 RepID=UPI003F7C63E2
MFTILLFPLCLLTTITAQFGGPSFGQQVQVNRTSGQPCSKTVSCMPAPWCQRAVDSDGCRKCSCSMGGFAGGLAGQSSFMNPMASMFHQMGGSGGFNSLTGPSGIGTGALPNSNQPIPTTKTACDSAPYTCSLPPPWCQRVVNSDSCVVCYCGQELKQHFENIQTGKNNQSTQGASNITETTTLKTIQEVSTTTVPKQATTTSCLQNFFCTTICDHGYMTDTNGCPLCQCIQPGSSGVVTTNAPVTKITTVSPIVTSGSSSGTIMCPGIFDCTLMCMSGYKIDSQGCPVCKCVSGSQT